MQRAVLVCFVVLLAGCLGRPAPEEGLPSEDPPDQAVIEVDDASVPVTGPLRFPSECMGRDVPSQTRANIPIAGHHCVPPQDLTLRGEDLGFPETPDLMGVRPGMNIEGCTSSYLLVNSTGALFLSTAAHCFEEAGVVTEDVFCDRLFKAVGADVTLDGFDAPGRLAWLSPAHIKQFGSQGTDCTDWDQAIVEVPRALYGKVHPAIRHIGGPTSLVDPLDLATGDAVTGYGNSDDRGGIVEAVAGQDHGTLPVWPAVNIFHGTFIGNYYDEIPPEVPTPPYECRVSWEEHPYCGGFNLYLRYTPAPKITGDSGSPDLTASGGAVGITTALNVNGAMSSNVLYDSLLRIWRDSGQRYWLVTWDEWSPETLEG